MDYAYILFVVQHGVNSFAFCFLAESTNRCRNDWNAGKAEENHSTLSKEDSRLPKYHSETNTESKSKSRSLRYSTLTTCWVLNTFVCLRWTMKIVWSKSKTRFQVVRSNEDCVSFFRFDNSEMYILYCQYCCFWMLILGKVNSNNRIIKARSQHFNNIGVNFFFYILRISRIFANFLGIEFSK